MNGIEDFYGVLSYLLTSALGLVNEPKSYGPLRLLDSTIRLIDVLEARGMTDDFLGRLRPRIQKAENLLEDERQFAEFLDTLILELVDKVSNH